MVEEFVAIQPVSTTVEDPIRSTVNAELFETQLSQNSAGSFEWRRPLSRVPVAILETDVESPNSSYWTALVRLVERSHRCWRLLATISPLVLYTGGELDDVPVRSTASKKELDISGYHVTPVPIPAASARIWQNS